MVANIRCKEIMSEKLEQLKEDQAWQGLCKEAEAKLVPELGATMAGLVSSCLSGYDEEAQYFDLVTRASLSNSHPCSACHLCCCCCCFVMLPVSEQHPVAPSAAVEEYLGGLSPLCLR